MQKKIMQKKFEHIKIECEELYPNPSPLLTNRGNTPVKCGSGTSILLRVANQTLLNRIGNIAIT